MTNIKVYLDGVLIDAKKIHFETLNDALSKVDNLYKITWDEHLNKYDGLKTKQKLDILSNERGLPINKHSFVWDEKQKLTLEILRSVNSNPILLNTILNLSKEGYKIACCSNSIRKTVLNVLSKLDIIE